MMQSRRRLFVGRDVELALLRGLLEQAGQGAARFAIMEGEPGIGKTSLLGECLDMAQQRGFRVLRAKGEELDRERPFGLLADALQLAPNSGDPERSRLGRLLMGTPQPAGDAADLRFHLVESICNLVEQAAMEEPLLLALEDLHWADPSSILVLFHLSRRVEYLPVVLLLTCRPTPRSAELERLLGGLTTARGLSLPLAPLSSQAVNQLVERLLGAPISGLLVSSIDGAAGNPLFVTELVRALQEEALIEVWNGVARLIRPLQPSPSLRLTILRRMNSLSRAALETLRMASVLGATFSVLDLAVFLGRPATELLAELEETLRAGFVEASGEGLTFRHDLVRESLYFELPLALRKALHLQAGRALAAAGAPTRQVAAHLSLGASAGDHECVAWLRRAARELAPRVPSAAIEYLERAIELLGPDDEQRDQLLADLMLPLVWAGRMDEAEARASELCSHTRDPALLARAYRCLGSVLQLQLRMPALARLCESALASALLQSEERAYFLGLSTMALLSLGDIDTALRRAEQGLQAGRATGVGVAVFLGLWAPAQAALLKGFYRDGAEQMRPIVEVAERVLAANTDLVGDIPMGRIRLGYAQLVYAWALLAADQLAEATATLHDARLNFERTSAASYITLCHRALANANYLMGRWDDALAEVEIARLMAEETGVHGLRAYQGDPAPLIHLHRGALRRAQADLALIERALGNDCPVVAYLWWLPTQAALAEAQGFTTRAMALLEETCQLADSLGLLPDYRVFGPSMVRLALSQGRRELAELAAGGATELAARSAGLPTSDGVALLTQGMLKQDPALLLAAVDAYRTGPRVFSLADACVEAGTVLIQHRRSQEAIDLLQEALQIYERLGAPPHIARVHQLLRSLGIRSGSRGSRRKSRVGWESLTPTERRVIELLVEGLSNPDIGERLYISRRTVQHHVSNIFSKLAVTSRTELAADAARILDAD